MNTWIFSKNGQVTEPLELAAAKKYVVDNEDAYGWHSSYTQWLPVSSINEFSALFPKPKENPQLPQKIVDEFLLKRQQVELRYEQLNKTLAIGDENTKNFEQEITNYKQLTVNLSDEVKSNINEIEQQYSELFKQLSDIKQIVASSQQDLNNIVQDFNSKVSEKAVIKVTAPIKALVKSAVEQKAPVAAATISKPSVTPEHENVSAVQLEAESGEQTKETVVELVTESSNNTQANVNVSEENTTAEPKMEKPTGAKAISTRARKPSGAKVVNTRSGPLKANVINETTTNIEGSSGAVTEASKPEANKVTSLKAKSDQANVSTANAATGNETKEADKKKTKLESGVKNIFKSVFTKEEPVSTKGKFAELVSNDTQPPVVEEVESHEDEELKTRRRRRRR